jgi:acetaldehyde dehydrogenase/alcohol dehydrogenase
MVKPSTDNVDEIMRKASAAAAVFSELDQAHTDRIARAVFEAGFQNRVSLAKLAVEETGIGRWQDKVIKNVAASLLVYEDIKALKTVGVIHEDCERGIVEIAQPLGPILALIPVTNPTSTVIFKTLIAMKTRNPIIIKPHPKATRSSNEAARVCFDAALKVDAPEDCIQWIDEMSSEDVQKIMSHRDVALILATGGGSVVKAAYSSGTPALGVGAGNVPVYIEKSADPAFAVEQIMASKLFDNGTICCSEQALVVEQPIAEKVRMELESRKARFLSPAEISKVEAVAYDANRQVMSSGVIGRSADTILRMAGIEAPPDVSVLIARLEGVGKDYPISSEILAPILAWYEVKDFDAAINRCIDLNYHGGIGHTASIYSNDEARILKFSKLMNAGRIVVNTPSSQGGVGGIFNTLNPSLTLGCGSGGKNITTDNITARHLINVQRIARRRVNSKFFGLDPGLFLDEKVDVAEIEKLYHRNT